MRQPGSGSKTCSHMPTVVTELPRAASSLDPSVTVHMLCVEPRENSADPCARGKISTSQAIGRTSTPERPSGRTWSCGSTKLYSRGDDHFEFSLNAAREAGVAGSECRRMVRRTASRKALDAACKRRAVCHSVRQSGRREETSLNRPPTAGIANQQPWTAALGPRLGSRLVAFQSPSLATFPEPLEINKPRDVRTQPVPHMDNTAANIGFHWDHSS